MTDHRAAVLVVEDFAPMRVLLERVLTAEGHQVTTAATGLVAREACAATEFELIVTDVHIPGGNGVDLARHVASRRPGLRVLFVSGDPERDLDLEVAGALTDFLQKPFDVFELATRVGRLLEADGGEGTRGRRM